MRELSSGATVSPVIYLTVELKHRELDSRLLIALHLLKAGFTVVVGQQWGIFANATALPPGVVLYKTVNEIQARSMPLFRRLGHLIAATDEEVLLCAESSCFVGALSKNSEANWHQFYAQSPMHRDAILRKFPGGEEKIIITGNARVDLMHARGLALFRDEAARCRESCGPYVLFNSNFAGINSIWGGVKRVAQINASAGGDDVVFNEAMEFEKNNRDELVKLIEWTADNILSHRVVIRPHPVENVGFWVERFGAHSRVTIVPRSSHIPWILGADVVAHSNCTTGIEAAIARVPTINVQPRRYPSLGTALTDIINPCVSSWKEAAMAIRSFLSDRSGPLSENADIEDKIEKYFSRYREGDAAAVIASNLGQLLITNGAKPDFGYRWGIVRGQQYRSFQRAEPLKEKMTVSVSEAVERIRRLTPLVDINKKITITTIEDSLFLLQAV